MYANTFIIAFMAECIHKHTYSQEERGCARITRLSVAVRWPEAESEEGVSHAFKLTDLVLPNGTSVDWSFVSLHVSVVFRMRTVFSSSVIEFL
jgi:hypothetical protein